VGELVLTHIWPAYAVAASARRAEESFGKPVRAAREQMRIVLERGDVRIVEDPA
jgi:hypothetical protein